VERTTFDFFIYLFIWGRGGRGVPVDIDRRI